MFTHETRLELSGVLRQGLDAITKSTQVVMLGMKPSVAADLIELLEDGLVEDGSIHYATDIPVGPAVDEIFGREPAPTLGKNLDDITAAMRSTGFPEIAIQALTGKREELGREDKLDKYAPEVDTSDIPEASAEWFEKAKLTIPEGFVPPAIDFDPTAFFIENRAHQRSEKKRYNAALRACETLEAFKNGTADLNEVLLHALSVIANVPKSAIEMQVDMDVLGPRFVVDAVDRMTDVASRLGPEYSITHLKVVRDPMTGLGIDIFTTDA